MLANNDARNSNKHKEMWRWFSCLALLSPVLIVYISHYLSQPNPTGFIQYDMPYYMANAREYFDCESFNLFYSNPFSSFLDSSHIYFQPQILFLGLLWKTTSLDPGIVFCLFGFISGLICLRLALLVYQTLFGFETWIDKLVFIMFCWGGGVLFVAGFFVNLFEGLTFTHAIGQGFRFDPSNGFWMLNFGRNLVYPTEAYYHAIYFGLIYSVIKEKRALTTILLLTLSLSHPYTGLEVVAGILLFQLNERFYLKKHNIPVAYILFTVAVLVLHITYYLGILNMDVEHHSLYQQWSLPWTFRAENFIPAYILVVVFFLVSIKNPLRLRAFFQKSENRLFAALTLVAFLLANHEFAFSPKQPIHFTHGYIWIPLFLLGVDSLKKFLIYLTKLRIQGTAIIACVALVFLLDNIMWIALNSHKLHEGRTGIHYTDTQKEVFSWINHNHINRRYLMLTNDETIGYLATVYTPVRSFISHCANTPFVRQKKKINAKFFKQGILHKILLNEKLLVVKKKDDGIDLFKNNVNFKEMFKNTDYTVYSAEFIKKTK